MDVQTVFKGITQFGFPIVMCLIFCWYINNITNKHSEQIKHLTEKHETESKVFVEALNHNTLVMQRLCDKLDSEELMLDEKNNT